MWPQLLIDQLVRPLIHRVGTIAGVALASTEAVTPDQVITIEAALVILGGLGLDLVTRRAL